MGCGSSVDKKAGGNNEAKYTARGGAPEPRGQTQQPADPNSPVKPASPKQQPAPIADDPTHHQPLERQESMQTTSEADPALDRKDSISRLTDEPGEISAALRLKYRVMKARITNGIDDDVDQFTEEIAESFPTLKEKEVRRINKWREECAAIADHERTPVPHDAFFFPPPPPPPPVLDSKRAPSPLASQYIPSDGATTFTESTAGNSVTDAMLHVHASKPQQHGAQDSFEMSPQQQPHSHHRKSLGIDAVAPQPVALLPHQVPPASPATPGPMTTAKSGEVGPQTASTTPQPPQGAGNGAGLFEFVTTLERASDPSSSRNASRNASRNVNPDDSRMLSDLMDMSTTSNVRTPHSPGGLQHCGTSFLTANNASVTSPVAAGAPHAPVAAVVPVQ